MLSSLKWGILTYRSVLKTTFDVKGKGRLIKDIIGENNIVHVMRGTITDHLRIRIRGNNNHLTIHEDCIFGRDCSIWMEGNDIDIEIGAGSTFTRNCHVNAQESFSFIKIGKDCMFSNNIIVRTSDSHPIYDITTNERINYPKPVVIGNHVWIAPNTKIMKGAIISDESIVGSDTTVSSCFNEKNVLIVGRPAKIVKTNVKWTRESLF